MSDTLGGPLNFEFDIKLENLSSKINKIESQLTGMTTSFERQGSKIDRVWNAAAGAIAGYLTIGAAANLAGSVIRVRSEFEKFESVLTTAYGSQERASRAMEMLRQTATETPFQLAELTQAFILLKNRGLEPSKKSLINLGDFASATGKNFEQVSQAILDANNSERWREFGVEVKTMGDKMQLSFKGTTVEVERSAAGAMKAVEAFGQLDGIAGNMKGQMETLGGKVSNLKDNWDKLLVTIGDSKAWKWVIDATSRVIDNVDFLINKREKFAAQEAQTTVDLIERIVGKLPTDQQIAAYERQIKSVTAAMQGAQDDMDLYQEMEDEDAFKKAQQRFDILKKSAELYRGLIDRLKGSPAGKPEPLPGLLETQREELKKLKEELEKAPNENSILALQMQIEKVEELIKKYESLLDTQKRIEDQARMVAEQMDSIPLIQPPGLKVQSTKLNIARPKVDAESLKLVEEVRARNVSNYEKMQRALQELDDTYSQAGVAHDLAYYKERGAIVSDYAAFVVDSFSEISNIVSFFDEKAAQQINELGKSVSGMLQGIASGNYLQAGLSAVTGLMQLGEMYIDTTWKGVDFEKQLDAINDALRESSELFETLSENQGTSYYSEYYKAQADSRKAIEEAQKNIALYEKNIKDAKDRKENAFANYGLLWWAEIKKAKAEIEKNEKLLEEQQAAIDQMEEDIKQAEQAWMENLTGTTADNLASALVEGFKRGESAAEIFSNNFKDIMTNALGEVLQRQIMDKMIADGGFYDQIAYSMEDGSLSPAELALLQQTYKSISGAAEVIWDGLSGVLDSLPGAEGSTSSLAGGIKGITEDTAGILAGNMNAIRISVLEQTEVALSSYGTLIMIEKNTKKTAANTELLLDIKNLLAGNSSLLTNRANGR